MNNATSLTLRETMTTTVMITDDDVDVDDVTADRGARFDGPFDVSERGP